MSSGEHTRAQELAIQASLALRDGQQRDALRLYAEAADFERRALMNVPESKPRTWGIIAVSAASLLYKAKKYDEVERLLYSLLAQNDIVPFARRQLRELLEAVEALAVLCGDRGAAILELKEC